MFYNPTDGDISADYSAVMQELYQDIIEDYQANITGAVRSSRIYESIAIAFGDYYACTATYEQGLENAKARLAEYLAE